jgi:NTE family protein
MSQLAQPKPSFCLSAMCSHGRVWIWLLFLTTAGCTSYGEIVNTEIATVDARRGYSLGEWRKNHDNGDITLILAFSGGGTRAAAMAYGVLEELRDTNFQVDGASKRLLDEVDYISSVSGGSFTAAFYGLHGDKIFDSFEDEFLRLDMDKSLTDSLINPLHWFTSKGRTERTIEYYEKTLFHGATFADMMLPGRPLIIINASDLAYGVRFSFVQEYFNFLCSDLTDFPVARAVAASSAVPILFNPVVIENYDACGDYVSAWPEGAAERVRQDPEFAALYNGLKSYEDKSQRKYIHFVDGGITDNMGLRASYDMVSLAGGPHAFFKKNNIKSPRRLVFISVNASTNPVTDMDGTNRQPSIVGAVNAMSGVQLHRYNTATLEQFKSRLGSWAEELSAPDHKVDVHFIQVTFEDINQPELKLSLNKIPTSFTLTDEQVDILIKTARSLLRENRDFQHLLTELDNEQ